MINEMKASFNTLLTEYPSGMNVNSLIAGKCFGVRQKYIVPGNGAAELIKSLMQSLPGRLGVVYPTFEEYPNRREKESIEIFIPQNGDFRYSVDDLIEYFTLHPVDALLLINPDNPSGNFIPKVDVFRLAEWCNHKSIKLIVDESFVDFSIGYINNTLLSNDILEAHPNLVVIKSISKSFGVPGLRLGILASSDTELIAQVKKDVSIWNLNSFAEFFMQIFNKYEADYRNACEKFVSERNRFQTELERIPYLRVIPSEANYFLCEVLPPYSSHDLAVKLLDNHNILIKDCSKKNGFVHRNYIRVAIRNKEDNNTLISSLKLL
jgi:histidinol-phosphate/aromatic aminotransferase/cobyric acid decarboxylase-like protein